MDNQKLHLTEEYLPSAQEAILTDYTLNLEKNVLIPSENKKYIKAYLFVVLAIVTLIVSFAGASKLTIGGANIASIAIVGQRALEEGSYKELELIYSGFASFIRAFGLFSTGVLVWLGLK
jgi:hypothetical protein